MNSDLSAFREQMNAINLEMSALFVKRMQLSKQIAVVKQRSGLPTEDRVREQEILESVLANVPDDLKPYTITYFQTLFELSKSYQCAIKESDSCTML